MGLEPTLASLREMRMEEVFRDVFFDFQETPTDRRALNAYVDLIDLYLRVLRETTNWLAEDGRRGAPIGRLLAAAAPAERLTVLTFNHDLVIENEIARRATLAARWCLDTGYGVSRKPSRSPPQKAVSPSSHSIVTGCAITPGRSRS